MRITAAVLAVLIAAGGLWGCANQQSTVRTKQGAVAGGVLGAVAGGIIGHQSGRGLEGAAIGAAAGAAAGGLLGSAADEQESQKAPAQPME